MLHLCFLGFTEEYIDEIKETLAGSNVYLLTLTALVTVLQVSHSFHMPIHLMNLNPSFSSHVLSESKRPAGHFENDTP